MADKPDPVSNDTSITSGQTSSGSRGERNGREFSLSEGRFDREFEKMQKDLSDLERDLHLDSDASTGSRSDKKNSKFTFNPFETPSKNTNTFSLTESHDYLGISHFAMARGFHVNSTIGGKHNPGSVHGLGRAVDLRTWDKTNPEVDAFMNEAKNAGLKVKDERTRPPHQEEWSGPHLHISTSERGQFKIRPDYNIKKLNEY